ncbi:MAG TPA: hypothetical protein VMT34_02185, partial [Aggregatilineales bacterium]|nr:hypothetical protein [Aggregatilineales bacterium]
MIVSASARHACRRCTSSCRNYDVMLSAVEAQRLSLNLWRTLLYNVPDDVPLVTHDSATGGYSLNKIQGRCVFLDCDDLCVIHKSSGIEAKPIVCQLFPLHTIASPAGIHISLNTGCHRLIEMTDRDPPLDGDDARRLLADVEAITTIGESGPLTPDHSIPYADFVDWQTNLIAILGTGSPDYAAHMRTAAALLLTLPGTGETPGLPPFNLYRTLDRLISGLPPARASIAALYARSQRWLPALGDLPALFPAIAETQSGFYARIARQYLEGYHAALHRTARTGWTALLAAMLAGIVGTNWLIRS